MVKALGAIQTRTPQTWRQLRELWMEFLVDIEVFIVNLDRYSRYHCVFLGALACSAGGEEDGSFATCHDSSTRAQA